jgi:hypothetical protein
MAKTHKSELKKVLNYLENEEEKHFEMEGGDDHIIHSVRFLREHQRKWRFNKEYRKWNVTFPEGMYCLICDSLEGDCECEDGHRTIPEGEYDINEVVKLLRDHNHNPEAIQYIADMMEN